MRIPSLERAWSQPHRRVGFLEERTTPLGTITGRRMESRSRRLGSPKDDRTEVSEANEAKTTDRTSSTRATARTETGNDPIDLPQ
jgi:hypothetical protein